MKNIFRYILFPFLIILSGCQEELFSKLSQDEVNEMLYILALENINSSKTSNKKRDSFILHVDKSDLSKAIIVLKDRGYPKDTTTDIASLFKKEGLVSSPLEERARYIYGLSQSIQETLTQIDGVLTARVHVVLPENDPFKSAIVPSSAAVYIKHHPSIDLKRIKTSIKLIVEKSIEGLSYNKVSVIMLPATSVGKRTFKNDSHTKNLNGSYASYLYYLLIPILLLLTFFLWKNVIAKNNEQLQELLAHDEP